MFELLTEKLDKVLKTLGGKGKLSERDIDEAMRQIRLALLEADVNFKVVKDFITRTREKAVTAQVLESLTPAQQIIKIVNEELTSILGESSSGLIVANSTPSIAMLVGLQGAGKTTTAAKLALYLKHSGQNPLLVAADIRRPAAVDQLVVLGKQLAIPVYDEGTDTNPLTICRNALKKAKEMSASWVVIDTQGRLHVDEELMKELTEIRNNVKPSEILLVVDAMTGQEAVRVAEEFNSYVPLTGLILTKMDGDARGGATLSIKYVTGVPIKFIGIGEKSNALEVYHPDRLTSRILGMGDMLTLIEKAEKTFDEQRLKKLEKKIRTAEFTLEDFLDQLNQLRKMGPIAQLVEMIPGFSKLPSNLLDETGDKQMKKIEAIILSMTPAERNSPNIINGRRRLRIAQGSGTTTKDVNQLLNQFTQVQKLAKAAAKGKLPKNLTGMFK